MPTNMYLLTYFIQCDVEGTRNVTILLFPQRPKSTFMGKSWPTLQNWLEWCLGHFDFFPQLFSLNDLYTWLFDTFSVTNPGYFKYYQKLTFLLLKMAWRLHTFANWHEMTKVGITGHFTDRRQNDDLDLSSSNRGKKKKWQPQFQLQLMKQWRPQDILK